MKRTIYLIIALIFFCQLFIFSANRIFATASSVDQQFVAGTGALDIRKDYYHAQVFRPAKSKLDKVSIDLASANGTMICEIRKWNGSTWPLLHSASRTATAGWNDLLLMRLM